MRRKSVRKIRYRPARKRRLRQAQLALGLVAALALALSASVLIQSARTASLNRTLEALRGADENPEVEIAAPPLETAPPATQAPGLPEGVALMGLRSAAPSPVTTAKVRDTLSDVLPRMRKLLEVNGDLVGWLQIDGVVNLPVVYRDNTYYLDHDFYGRPSASGTLFLDQSHPLTETARNLVIYGHAMHDGAMFGHLTGYRRQDFLDEHPLIRFSTLWEEERYAVFAVLRTPETPDLPGYVNFFTHASFASEDDFTSYAELLRSHAILTADVDVRPGDALLTLVTCVGDDRLVVVARRLDADDA